MNALRAAIAGYGRFGSRQAEIIAGHPAVELVGIADPDKDARNRAVQQHPQITTFEEPVRMLADVEPHCVFVTSPEDTHAAIARVALERGIHVFSEKPLATELEQARQLRDLAERRGVVYQAGYILRYEPRHALLAEQVPTLGTLTRLRVKRHCSRSWFLDYGKRIHPVYETLVHDIDLVLWLAGQRCQTVHAWERGFLGEQVPETFLMVLELEGGAVAVAETSWLIPDGAVANITGWGEGGGQGDGVIDADLEVIGVDGVASLRTYEPSLTIVTSGHTYVPDTGLWPTIGGRTGGALREELWDFIERAAGGEGRGVASIDDALHVQEIADAAVVAARRGTAVEVPA